MNKNRGTKILSDAHILKRKSYEGIVHIPSHLPEVVLLYVPHGSFRTFSACIFQVSKRFAVDLCSSWKWRQPISSYRKLTLYILSTKFCWITSEVELFNKAFRYSGFRSRFPFHVFLHSRKGFWIVNVPDVMRDFKCTTSLYPCSYFCVMDCIFSAAFFSPLSLKYNLWWCRRWTSNRSSVGSFFTVSSLR